jgi:hypothetical protein
MDKISVKIKSVYGVDKIYPACRKSELFARIAGTMTLTPATIERIKSLGYEIKVIHDIESL